MNVKDNVQNGVNEMIQHPDYKIEIVKVLRSNLSPKIKYIGKINIQKRISAL